MAVTTLKRKKQKNRLKSRIRQVQIKRLTAKPVIKKVDVEALKAEFENTPKTAEKKEDTKAEAKKESQAEAKVKEGNEKPKAEKEEQSSESPKAEAKAPKAEKAAEETPEKEEDKA
jgi:hypothetical protein